MYCVMTCIRVMEMCMVLCSFCDNFAMCWGKYVMYLNFFFTCVFTALCIGIHSCALFVLCIVCVVYWFTFTGNCCVLCFELVNFLYIDCFMYLGLYFLWCAFNILISCCIGYTCTWLSIVCVVYWFALCDCIIHVYWALLCIFCGVFWLHLAVYIVCVTYLLIRWWIWCWNISLPKSFIKICKWYPIIQSSKQSWTILIQKDWITLLVLQISGIYNYSYW